MVQAINQQVVNDGPVFGWRDITGQIVSKGVGVADPTFEQIGTGPFWGYNFAINDALWVCFHVPHDVVPVGDDSYNGTPLFYFHAHWVSDGTDSDPVKWEFTYTHALGFGQGVFDMGTGTVCTAEEAAAGVAYTHMVTESAGQSIATITEPDGLVYTKIKRVTAGSPDNQDNIYLLMSDIHYLSNSMGTYSRSPSFYTPHA